MYISFCSFQTLTGVPQVAQNTSSSLSNTLSHDRLKASRFLSSDEVEDDAFSPLAACIVSSGTFHLSAPFMQLAQYW